VNYELEHTGGKQNGKVAVSDILMNGAARYPNGRHRALQSWHPAQLVVKASRGGGIAKTRVFAKRTHRFSSEFIMQPPLPVGFMAEVHQRIRWVRFGKRTQFEGGLGDVFIEKWGRFRKTKPNPRVYGGLGCRENVVAACRTAGAAFRLSNQDTTAFGAGQLSYVGGNCVRHYATFTAAREQIETRATFSRRHCGTTHDGFCPSIGAVLVLGHFGGI
jgi:hypothetical protein